MITIKTIMLLLPFCILGCQGRTFDSHREDPQTWHDLGVWAEYIKTSHAAGGVLHEKKSLEEALSYLGAMKVVSAGHADLFLRTDGWGRPFQWTSTRDDKQTRVRVLSLGPDGISQDGQGDDIFVLVAVPKKGDVSISYSPKQE